MVLSWAGTLWCPPSPGNSSSGAEEEAPPETEQSFRTLVAMTQEIRYGMLLPFF